MDRQSKSYIKGINYPLPIFAKGSKPYKSTFLPSSLITSASSTSSGSVTVELVGVSMSASLADVSYMARQKTPRRISRNLPDMMNNEKAAVKNK